MIVRLLIVSSTSTKNRVHVSKDEDEEGKEMFDVYIYAPKSHCRTSFRCGYVMENLAQYTWENYKLMSNRTLPLNEYWIYNIKQLMKASLSHFQYQVSRKRGLILFCCARTHCKRAYDVFIALPWKYFAAHKTTTTTNICCVERLLGGSPVHS